MRRGTVQLFAFTCLLCGLFTFANASEQVPNDAVRIGVLTDMGGPYSDNAGPGTVLATEMAVADFGGKVLGKPIEVISGDHLNKPDAAALLAREWIDVRHVDAIVDVIGSAVAYAVQHLTNEKNRVLLISGAGASDLTGPSCSETSVQWTWDTYAYANLLGRALVKRGLDTWFFVTVDYSYGEQLQRDMTAAVASTGGKVLGGVRHPLGTTDFASYLLQAQSSKSKVVALANAGNDALNSVKQASEFGIRQGGQELAAIVAAREVRALGLKVAEGIILPTAFYWDRDDQTRAFAKRFFERRKVMPSEFQAGTYSSVLHYLRAIQAAGTIEAKPVVRKMQEIPVDDFFARHARLRRDGRMVHDMYLMQAKSPAESTGGDWDVLKLLATIPGDEAFRPMEQGGCPLVKTTGK